MRSWPFRLMLLATVLGFGGYALLLPVVPLWVSGAGELAAGSTTGALMLTTIGTQLAVPWLVARLGYRTVLGAGLVLLGAPTPLLALSAELGPVLAVSAARGVGFGLLTVVGSALVAELAAPSEHGRAAARYGVAVGVPQLVLLPAGVAVVDVAGFTGVFVAAGAAPLLGLLALPALRVPRPTPVAADGEPGPARPRPASAPLVAMLSCSVAQGGLVTFLPLAVPGAAGLVAAALFATAAGALLGRTTAGRLVDRHGLGGRLLLPGVLLAAAGMAVEVLALGAPAGPLVVVGSAVVGVGFGLVQNDALTTLFAAGGPAGYGSASAAWNIAYDAGTGVGAVGLGAVADPFGFRAAFGLSAIALLLVGPAARRSR
ncbi:MFS transporter [Pseudonocardia broussonetiae]|uniref:MFS transporter n=1 Tax=Pseudonocardia broussonetiae TaxID=2736640 RepID=A0A6M6JTH7_9PSEU|nr:MFS transporter [Pseudonocardia broussonetiae]QJY50376.1 MFS transporter [Pseudonocardia broussonetiae]